MTRLLLALVLLAGCPMRDIRVEHTPVLALTYSWYGQQCQQPTATELQSVGEVWTLVVTEAQRLGFISRLHGHKVRLCLTPGPFHCGTIWANGCAGSNAIVVSRTGAFRALLAGEFLNHLVASSQTVLLWATPEFGPAGILADPRYRAVLLAVGERL